MNTSVCEYINECVVLRVCVHVSMLILYVQIHMLSIIRYMWLIYDMQRYTYIWVTEHKSSPCLLISFIYYSIYLFCSKTSVCLRFACLSFYCGPPHFNLQTQHTKERKKTTKTLYQINCLMKLCLFQFCGGEQRERSSGLWNML